MKTVNFILLLLSIIIFNACSTKKVLQKSSSINSKLEITAINLSENFTKLATQNDEVFIIIIKGNKDSALLIYNTFTIFDYNKASFDIPLKLKNFEADDMLAVVLIEQDTDINLSTITSKVLQNFSDLQTAYLNKNHPKTHAILGDDDLLGIAVFTKKEIFNKNGTNILIKGVRLLDKYSYSVYIAK